MIVSSELFPVREGTLKTHLETYVVEILKTKEKKFIRDKLSYDNNQAYSWASTKTNKRRNLKMWASKETHSEPNGSDTSSASSLSSQALDRTAGHKESGFSKRTNGNANKPTGLTKHHQNTNRAPIHTRATAAKINTSHAPGHRDTISNTNVTNLLLQTPTSQVSNVNDIITQSDFRPAPIFTQLVHDRKRRPMRSHYFRNS